MLEKLRGRKPTLIDFEQYRHYAVVIPLIEKDGTYEVLFEVRSSKLNRQPGEICFPGGKCDAGETSEQAAHREICEELLIQRYKVQLDYYQTAIEQLTGKKVKDRILYSVIMNREIHC